MSIKNQIVIAMSVFLLTCMSVANKEPPKSTASVLTDDQERQLEWEEATKESDEQWAKEVADKTYNDLIRDIKQDIWEVENLSKCLINEDKTYYQCQKEADK